MNFLEAVKEMKKGKLCKTFRYYYRYTDDTIRSYYDYDCKKETEQRLIMMWEFESNDWEVIEDKPDKPYGSLSAREYDKIGYYLKGYFNAADNLGINVTPEQKQKVTQLRDDWFGRNMWEYN